MAVSFCVPKSMISKWISPRIRPLLATVQGTKHILGRMPLNIQPRPSILDLSLPQASLAHLSSLLSSPLASKHHPNPFNPACYPLPPSSYTHSPTSNPKTQIPRPKNQEEKKIPTYQHRPRLPTRITSNPTLPPIPQHNRNPIALPHPPLSQRMRQSRTPLIQLSIRETCVLTAGDQGGAVAVRGYDAGEVLREGLREEGGLWMGG